MAYLYSRYESQDLLCSDANKNGRIIVKCLISLKESNIYIGINVRMSHGMQVQYNFLEGCVLEVPLTFRMVKKLLSCWWRSMMYCLQVRR